MFGYPGGWSCLFLTSSMTPNSALSSPATSKERPTPPTAMPGATGKVGVCLATSGPGATNLVTGIANAYMDSIPMVAITGQVKTFLIGNDAFQEADITGITRSISKHNYLVKDVRDLARVVREAFHIASTGRPGPVLIDLPVDVQQAECEFSWPEEVNMPGYKPTYFGHSGQIKKRLS